MYLYNAQHLFIGREKEVDLLLHLLGYVQAFLLANENKLFDN